MEWRDAVDFPSQSGVYLGLLYSPDEDFFEADFVLYDGGSWKSFAEDDKRVIVKWVEIPEPPSEEELESVRAMYRKEGQDGGAIE